MDPRESASVLKTVDEEVAHMSPTARWPMGRAEGSMCVPEFDLASVTHWVSGVGDIQCFWPLNDMIQVRRDIQASIKEQSGTQKLVFQYRAREDNSQRSVALAMADGTLRTATTHGNSVNTYNITYSFVYHQDEYTAVSASMLRSAIQAGDLARLKKTIRTANHLNMGINDRPIHMAIEYKQLHILEWLVVQPGIDVDKLPMDSNRPTLPTLLRPIRVGERTRSNVQCLCILLRAGMTLMSEDPVTGFNIFHYMVGSQFKMACLMEQEDIAQRLLEHAACAFEPTKAGRPGDTTRSPPFMDFLKRAETMLCLTVSVHIPVSALTTIIVSYITQS